MRKSANDEKQLLDSFERGEWKPAAENERRKYADYAKATLRKDRRVNIRIWSAICADCRSARSRKACRTRPSCRASSTSTLRGA